MRAPSGGPAGTASRQKISFHCFGGPGLPENHSPSHGDVIPGCQQILQAPPSHVGVWTRSHSDVRAAVHGEGCRGWVYSPPQPLLCLEVEHKSHVLSGCPICSALPKDMPRKPHKTTVHVLIPSLSFLSIYFTPFHPCWKLCSPPCHRSTA